MWHNNNIKEDDDNAEFIFDFRKDISDWDGNPNDHIVCTCTFDRIAQLSIKDARLATSRGKM